MDANRRERKKRATRQALVAAAVELFEEQGYDRTTISQIAEAADVSERTFYLHFPTKEDVLVGDAEEWLEPGLRALADRHRDESIRDVLSRVLDAMIETSWSSGTTDGRAADRARHALSTPAVHARVLESRFRAHSRLVEAVHAAFPDELDEVQAAAVIGSLTGAVYAASMASLSQGHSPPAMLAAMRDAAAMALATPALTPQTRTSATRSGG